MNQNPNDKKTCDVCQQSFNSERELQEHQRSAHSQRKQSESHTGGDRNTEPGQDHQKSEKIA